MLFRKLGSFVVVVVVFLCGVERGFCIDKVAGKVALAKEFHVPGIDRELELSLLYDQSFNVERQKAMTHKYGVEACLELCKYLEYAFQYKYAEERVGENKEAIENNLAVKFDLPKEFEFCDENKIVTFIRRGENSYENESELSRKIFSYKKADFSLFAGDVAVYDFSESRWCENTVKAGMAVKFGSLAKLKITYGYVDVIDDCKSERTLETKWTIYF